LSLGKNKHCGKDCVEMIWWISWAYWTVT